MKERPISVYKSEENEYCCGCGLRRLSGVSTIYLPYCPCLVWVCDDCKQKLGKLLMSEEEK